MAFWSKLAMVAGLAVLCIESVDAQGHGPERPEDSAYDKIVNDFIKFDIGQIRDPRAIEQIKARFAGLRGDESVPALVRGLNVSTRMRASCPITALSTKLRTVVNSSKDPEVGTFVLQHLENNNVGPYSHYVSSIFEVAEAQVVRTMGKGLAEQRFKQRAQAGLQKLVHTPGLKLTDLPPRASDGLAGDDGFDKPLGKPGLTRANTRRPAVRDTAPEPPVDMSKLTVMELASRLNEGSGQAKVLAELFRRASAGEDDGAVADAWQPIVQCLRHGDDWSREAAARLLGLVRCQPATEPLIDALEDSDAKVRSAAATALTRITRQLFGPGDDATPDERRVALTRWREWFARQSKPSSAR